MKETTDAEAHIDHLFGLFKKRGEVRRSPSVSLLAPSASEQSLPPLSVVLAPPLNEEKDRPEGLSQETWDKVVQLRDEKVQSEAK
jgi:hypothetical protein